MLVLRNFSPDDLESIMYMIAEGFNQDYDPYLYLMLHEHWPDGLLVVVKDGAVVGFIMGNIISKDEARILLMIIDGKNRAAGVGTALLKEFVNRCAVAGVKRISLEVRTLNQIAQRFYARFGWENVELLKSYYSDGGDAYRMVKWL